MEELRMIDLKNSLISSQWPNPDEIVESYAYALKQAVQRVIRYADKARCYADVDSLGEDVLDELAVELKAVNYLQKYPIEKKRSIIKSALLIYMRAGTVGAVRKYIQAAYEDSSIEEWYKYGGTYGHYRINIYDLYSEEKIELIRDAMAKIGKFSAELDSIDFFGGDSTANLCAAAGTATVGISVSSQTI